jgi:predicted NBD/HSP70 family sugar kinase
MGGNQNITKAYDVFQALRANPTDRVLRESFSRYKDDLSTGLANLVTFYNPDTIAIGGGLSQVAVKCSNILRCLI